MYATCYDNAFADVQLNKGNKPAGIYGYFNMFRWRGFIQVLWFAAAYNAVKFVLMDVFDIIFMGAYMFLVPDLRFCNPGEWVTGTGYDICVEWFGGGGQDLVEFGEAASKTGIKP